MRSTRLQTGKRSSAPGVGRGAWPRHGVWLRRFACAACLLWCGLLLSQGPGGRGPGGPGGGPGGVGMGGRTGMPGDGRGPGRSGGLPPGSVGGPGSAPNNPGGNAPVPGARGPLQQGPGGRWWDERKYARTVGLTNDQQRRMDGVFAENRANLVSGLDTLRRAQARLDAVSKSDHPSEAAVLSEIQNVAQARADLEKANTHMLLQLRNEMTTEQLNKLEKLQ